MEKDIDSNSGDKARKSKIYFIIGYVFLLSMALFWSVDSSIVLILFSIAFYFLFLGFYSRPSTQKKEEPRRTTTYQAGDPSITFAEAFKNILQKKPGSAKQTAKTYTTPSTPEAQRKLVTMVVVAVFVVFFIFFIGSIFFSSSNEAGNDLAYFQEAEQYYSTGNYDSAYVKYRQAWRANDQYAEAMLGYANVLTIRDQADSAIIMFDKTLAINPEYKEATYGKALVYFNQKRYDESIGLLNPLLEENADYYDAMLLIGDCYFDLKKNDESLQWYANAYENGGVRSEPLCYRLGYLYDTKGNYSEAIDRYKEVLNYDTTIVDIYRRLGELLPNEDGNYYRIQAVKLQQSN